jgi:hypothetical protein
MGVSSSQRAIGLVILRDAAPASKPATLFSDMSCLKKDSDSGL